MAKLGKLQSLIGINFLAPAVDDAHPGGGIGNGGVEINGGKA